MTRTSLRLSLAAVVLAAASASAQYVTGNAGAASAGSAAATAGAASRATPSMPIPSLSPAPGLLAAPSLSASAAPSLAAPSLAAPSVAVSAQAAPALARPALAAPALASKRAAADGPTPLQEPIRPGERWHGADPRMGTGDEMVHDGPRGRNLVPLSSFEPSETPDGWRTDRARSARLFDGARSRRELMGEPSVAGQTSRSASPLAKPSAASASPTPAAAVPAAPAVRASRGTSLAFKIALAVALLLLTPGIALAAPVGAPITVASTLALMAALRPAASAVGAIAGAIYGMSAARSKDGAEVSSGEMLSSVLRYGALGGAAVYMLMDVTALAFLGGTGAGIQPLSSAVVTAALGRTAFQGKFMDAATTSADRIVGAFPAVAAALGISLGVTFFVAPPVAVTVALAAMTITGVATALFTAIFKLGRSPLNGPALMGKGFVLQALMTGLALAVSSPYLFWIFAAMGAAGFGLVLWAMAQELLSFLPGRAVPAPAPGPTPTPPTPPIPKA